MKSRSEWVAEANQAVAELSEADARRALVALLAAGKPFHEGFGLSSIRQVVSLALSRADDITAPEVLS